MTAVRISELPYHLPRSGPSDVWRRLAIPVVSGVLFTSAYGMDRGPEVFQFLSSGNTPREGISISAKAAEPTGGVRGTVRAGETILKGHIESLRTDPQWTQMNERRLLLIAVKHERGLSESEANELAGLRATMKAIIERVAPRPRPPDLETIRLEIARLSPGSRKPEGKA